MEVFLKAALIPLVILAVSLASRRLGHGFAGVVSGFLFIAAPVMLMLMLQYDPTVSVGIAGATLAALPACVAFIVCFAWLARKAPWWLCLAGSSLTFVAVGLLIAFSEPWVIATEVRRLAFQVALPLVAPTIGFLLMPKAALRLSPIGAARSGTARAPIAPAAVAVRVPPWEIVVRMLAGLLMGIALLLGAGHFDPVVSGLMLTWPVTGSVLPSFTAALHGPAAAVLLLRGFVQGLTGFALFFLTLTWLIRPGVAPLLAFLVAVAVPMALAGLMHRMRTR